MTGPRQAVFLPPFDALADPVVLADLAADAEAAGWDGMFLWDHMTYSPPVEAILDPWICMAAMAVATDRLLLGAMVTPLSRRRPAVLARQAITLDLLSGGRLVLGFGLGDDGSTGEMRRFGEEVDPAARARMLDEGLELLSGLLSGRPVDHAGVHYRAEATFLPAPSAPSGIPTWIAGRWPNQAPLRRAARHDGAFVINVADPAEAADLVARLRDLRGSLDGFDVVVELPDGADPAAWSVPGITWLLTRIGPYRIDLADARARVASGPTPVG